MCVDDMLKRYIDMHGRLNEFLECDSNFDVLDYFLEHQTSFPTYSKCVEFIIENRHSLYESLANRYANALDIKERAKKWYDSKVYYETLKVFSESNKMIQDRQIYSFFELVMREIINTDQTLVTRRADELSRSELRTVKRKHRRLLMSSVKNFRLLCLCRLYGLDCRFKYVKAIEIKKTLLHV